MTGARLWYDAIQHLTPDRLGDVCPACHLRIPLSLGDVPYHPTCDPASRALIARCRGVG